MQSGQVVKEVIANGSPQPSDFLVFNTRRPQFADIRVREALSLLFDFEWINQNYFFNLYQRSGSYFAGSDLSAYGVPANDRERALLKPFTGEVRADIMDGTFKLPASDTSGRDRETLRRALGLLAQAGYEVSNKALRRKATGQPFTFEILTTTRDQERIALAYARDLKRAGITPSVRVVDAVQFDQRRLAYDFDMIQNRWDQSLSPGNEQAFYFGSSAADNQGTRNYMGVKSAGDRCDDRRDAGDARARRFRRRGPRARSRADVGLLRHSRCSTFQPSGSAAGRAWNGRNARR